jgi:dihydropteroate synthase
MQLRLAASTLQLDSPCVMGVLNVTPDSFSDGGRFFCPDDAIRQADKMAAEGASIIDVGGESTRPGSAQISVQAELERVASVIESICQRVDVPVSVDTSKPAVMQAAVAAGAGMINDVFALGKEGSLQTAAGLNAAVCLMHMQGAPATMQDNPRYDDVVGEIADFLELRVERCRKAGISNDRICVDPGFGFGKSDRHNLALLQNLDALQRLGLPILVGLSRKGTLGSVTGKALDDRVAAGVAAATIAVLNGANIVRTHDVGATVDALKLVQAMRDNR